MSAPPSINLKIDSGATHHFHEIGIPDLPQQPNSNYNPAAQLIVTNRASMVSSATTHLPSPSLTLSVTKSCGLNHLLYIFFFSVRQSFEHNCTAVFDNNSVKMFNFTEVDITALCPPIIKVNRNAPSRPLYSVYLPTPPPSIHKSNSTINFSSIQ